MYKLLVGADVSKDFFSAAGLDKDAVKDDGASLLSEAQAL